MKVALLNLTDSEIPASHELLNLGTKFVHNITVIPNLDIVSKTESSSLKLEYLGGTNIKKRRFTHTKNE